jgi:formylmethanofuran dehydrogenase subunit E
MSAALELLARLRGHGVTVWGEGDSLYFRPKHAVTAAQIDALRQHKRAILATLAADDGAVMWRLEALRMRYPDVGGGRPIPLLTVDKTRKIKADRCATCGEPLATGERLRCTPCLHAIRLLLNDILSYDK